MLTAAEVDEVYRRLAEGLPAPPTPTAKVKKNAFRSLVSVMLSAQSPDARTAEASRQLFEVAASPATILALPDGRLEALIKPAGLYNLKARNLRAMCRELIARFGGQVPKTRAELMSLPGVGRKCADIMLRFTFEVPVIAVDTHVHRLCNRLGLATGKTEAQTAASLEARTPPAHRMAGHMLLLEHGKRVCRARQPRCEICVLEDLCRARRSA